MFGIATKLNCSYVNTNCINLISVKLGTIELFEMELNSNLIKTVVLSLDFHFDYMHLLKYM